MPRKPILSTALALALAACSAPAPEAPPSTDTAPAPQAAPAPADAGPETDAGSAAAGTIPAGPGPRGEHDADVVNFNGFGPARFGSEEEAVRQAWGRPLQPYKLAGTQLCYYLEMDPRPERGADVAVAFMFEGAKFVRYDVNGTTPVAPGGFIVGSHADDIVAAFGSRVEQQPHKYIGAGRYLIVTPEYGEEARLVFEVDGEGRVIEWRIGLPPQVFYVEGCA
jgi:hypothetical protein